MRLPSSPLHAPWRPQIRVGLLVLAAATLTGCFPDGVELPQERPGFLDLRRGDLNGIVRLDGQWLARAGVDSLRFAAFDYEDDHWRPVPVVASFEAQGFPREGTVWYRMELRLPRRTPPLLGYILQADNAHELYVARPGQLGVRVAASGRPRATRDDAELSRTPAVFAIPADTSLVLTWRVASYDYRSGGPYEPILIGSPQAVVRSLQVSTAFTAFALGLYVMIALSLIVEWGYRRADYQALVVAALAVVLAIRTASTSGLLETLAPAFVTFDVRIFLELSSWFWSLGLLGLLAWTFFPGEFAPLRWRRFELRPPPIPDVWTEPSEVPLWRRRLHTAGFVLALSHSVVFTLVALLSGPEATSAILPVSWAVAVVLIPALASVIVAALRARRPLAAGTAVGLGVLVLAGLSDLLRVLRVLPEAPLLLGHGFVVFVAWQAFVLGRRNAVDAEDAAEHVAALERDLDRHAKALRASAIAAEAAALAKGQFVSAVSHELRTPVAALQGYAQLLADELDSDLDDEQRAFFRTIIVSAERLTALVDDLLDIARLDADHIDLAPRPTDAVALVEEVVDQFFPTALEKGLVVEITFDERAHQVLADPDRLRQVLMNLLSNAIKFTDEGHIHVRTRADTLGERPALAIEVEDTGAGIAPAFLPHVFDRFTQDAELYRHTARGTGLGLTLSQALVRKMGGTISVESTPGAGSTFTVRLPVLAPRTPMDAASEAEPSSEAGAPPPATPG